MSIGKDENRSEMANDVQLDAAELYVEAENAADEQPEESETPVSDATTSCEVAEAVIEVESEIFDGPVEGAVFLKAELVEDDDDSEKIFYESEVVDDVVELEPLEDDELVDTLPPVDEPEEEVVEVVYEVDPITDDEDEEYELPRFINLPNLIDYMLSLGMTKKMKINMALLLAMAYDKFKNKKDEKTLLLKCMYKVLLSIASKK